MHLLVFVSRTSVCLFLFIFSKILCQRTKTFRVSLSFKRVFVLKKTKPRFSLFFQGLIVACDAAIEFLDPASFIAFRRNH